VRRAVLAGLVCVLALSACAQQQVRHVPEDLGSVAECAAEPRASLSALALPIEMPPGVVAKRPGEASGPLARRLTVSFAPGTLARGDSLLWTHLEVRTLGGTLDGWLKLQSGALRIDAASSSARRGSAREQAAIAMEPGLFDLRRSAAYGTNLANAVRVDLLLRPGGIPIDESLVRVRELWAAKGKPLQPDAVHVELEPIHHVPGYDTIEAEIKLEYVIARAGEGAECKGTAQQRVVLVSREDVRPPLWDIGTSSTNSGRTRWLALSDPASGVFRAIFDSPAAAASFANWVRATQATQVGPYRIGLVQRSGRQPMRPLVPVDRGIEDTFAPMTPQDLGGLRTGPLGEP
jgi:hypothetical protein